MQRCIWLILVALALTLSTAANASASKGPIKRSLAWVIATDGTGEITGRAMGLAVAPDLLLVPLHAIVLADSIEVPAEAGESRKASGVVAFDAIAGLALVRVPGLDLRSLHSAVALPDPLPDAVALITLPQIDAEPRADTDPQTEAPDEGVAPTAHRVLQVLDDGFRGPRLRLDHDFTLGSGGVVVDDAGAAIAMTTEWAGNDRVFAVAIADFLGEHLPPSHAAPFPPGELLDRAQGDVQRSSLLAIRAQVLRRQTPPDELIPLLEEAVELAPDNAGAWYLLGVKLDEAGRKADGLAALEKAVALEPAWGEPWYSLGLVQLTSERPVEAERSFRRAVARDEAHADSHAMLGAAMLYQGRAEDALGPMERSCELAPSRLQFAQNFQIALIRARGEREAYRAWGRYVSVVPDDRRAHVQYLYALIQAERLETLEQQAARGLEQFGENIEDLALHAYASLNLGRDPKLVRALVDRTLALDPDNPIALNVLNDLP